MRAERLSEQGSFHLLPQKNTVRDSSKKVMQRCRGEVRCRGAMCGGRKRQAGPEVVVGPYKLEVGYM